MPTLLTKKDVRQARRRTEESVTQAVERVRSPLLAVLGAVDATAVALNDAVVKARDEAEDRASDTQSKVQTAVTDLQGRLTALPSEIAELRTKLDAAELRKLADAYTEIVQKAYTGLVERGEAVFGDFTKQPKVQAAVDSVESGVDGAQERLEAVVAEVNSVADEFLARFAKTSRSVGEKTARRTEFATSKIAAQVRRTSTEAADAVEEAGGEVAADTRSVTRKTANRAAAPKKPAARRAPSTASTTKPASKRSGPASKS